MLSYDMGGTTAKICMIDDARPQTARIFEIARAARFMKGSGMTVRLPVIEMIEIGAGGGSIAGIDGLGRISVGPRSAGSEPGPSCYARGGTDATVTDADLVLGRLEATGFAGGSMTLDTAMRPARPSGRTLPIRFPWKSWPERSACRKSSTRTWPAPPRFMRSSEARS